MNEAPAMHECIPLSDPSGWKEALAGIKHSFAHTWEHCYAMHFTSGLDTYLHSFHSNGRRVVCPIAEREYKGYTDIVKPFGFSGFVANGECPEFGQSWKEFVQCKSYIAGYLGLNPVFDYSSHFSANETFHYDDVYVLDLTLGFDQLWKGLSSNRRRQLKDYDTIRSAFSLDKEQLIDFFLAHHGDFLRRKNAADFYLLNEDTLRFLLYLDNVIMIGAPSAAHLTSVSVFAYTDDAGDYLFNVSLPEGEKYGAALVWCGLNMLKSLRIPLLNLGGGEGGVSEFKRRFGGTELPLKCVKQIYRPDIYTELCRSSGVDPDDMTSYFPAYRRKK